MYYHQIHNPTLKWYKGIANQDSVLPEMGGWRHVFIDYSDYRECLGPSPPSRDLILTQSNAVYQPTNLLNNIRNPLLINVCNPNDNGLVSFHPNRSC